MLPETCVSTSKACMGICSRPGKDGHCLHRRSFQELAAAAEFRNLVLDRLGCMIEAPRLSPAAGALLEALRADGNASTRGNVPESEK